MISVGTINGYSIQASETASPYVINQLNRIYDVRKDIFGPDEALLLTGYTILNRTLSEEIEKVKSNNLDLGENKIKYEFIKLASTGGDILIDKFNAIQRELPFMDTLVKIFQEGIYENKKFYSYYIPLELYNIFYEDAFRILKGQVYQKSHLDNEVRDSLLKYDLIEPTSEKVILTEKMKAFC